MFWVLESNLEGTASAIGRNLKDGAHVLSITAADISGKLITKEWNFNVNVKPTFSNPSHADGKDTNNKNAYSIKVTDNDGINASSTGILSYNPANGFSDGPYSIKITLQDLTGNVATYNSNFTVCASGPILKKKDKLLPKIKLLQLIFIQS
ncbi:hypothetical protein V7111_18075 [Neobacillus niacini]|uniref:hypothetical protein n=1 Tax=Neobacillus niacini TaxID=86668 RepID=UPI003001D9A2